jgi:hypothetical protein
MATNRKAAPITVTVPGVADSADGVGEIISQVAAALAPAGAGQGTGGELSAQLAQLTAVSQMQAGALAENTKAIVQNTVTQSSGSGSVAGSAASTAWKIFSSGLGLSPLVKGIVSLFGGGSQTTQTTLVQYQLPPAINVDAGVSRSGTATSGATIGAANAAGTSVAAASGAAQAAAPQITIQVNAMDSRSFLDHSDDIARAVKDAMLNAHSLNDVVGEI